MTKKSVKDYYAVLGVPQNASMEEIRLAYRRQARAYHPDLSGEPHAEERFKEINEAYEVLANAEKRKAYDYFTAGDAPEAKAEPTSTDSAEMPSTVAEPRVAASAQPAAATGQTESASQEDERRGRIYPPTWAILLIVLGGCIIVTVAIGSVLSLRDSGPTGGAESVTVTKLTTFISPPTIPADLTVIQEDGTPLRTVAPTRLNVAGTIFPVTTVLPEQGRWPLPVEQSGLALWMHGTLINYVIGLPYAASTESLLGGLTAGDQITLTLENGTRLAFGSPQPRRVDPGDVSPMAQDKPGLTLMILGTESPSRLVVKARYLPEDTLPAGEQEADGLTVEIRSAHIVEGVTPSEIDSWFFVVEYQITNTTPTDADPTFFDMRLEDGRGQSYGLSNEATRRGEYGELSAPVQAGTTVNGSAGYVIPRDVRSPLVWIFRADATSTDSIRFVTDFEPPAPAPAQPDVELYEAFLDANRDVIVVSGTVYNDGESGLTVSPDGIALTSSVGEGTLVATSPPLPWSVPADDYQDFELQFAAPEGAGSVLLNVLGFAFEIEGIRP